MKWVDCIADYYSSTVADPGSLKGGLQCTLREILEATPISIVLRQTTSPISPIVSVFEGIFF